MLGDCFAFVEADLAGAGRAGMWRCGHGPGRGSCGRLACWWVAAVACQVSMSAWVRAAGWRPRACGPGQEVLGLDEPLLGVFAGAGPQWPGGGPGAHAGELVPEAELAQQPLVRVAGQVREAAVHPAFVVGELPVSGGEGAAADAAGRAGRSRLAGRGRRRAWWVSGRRPVVRSASRPRMCGVVSQRRGRRGVGGGGQCLSEGPQGGAEVAGAAEEPGDGLGAGAGVAEPAGGQVAFVAAAQAGEMAADPGAVTAERCLAGGAAAG